MLLQVLGSIGFGLIWGWLIGDLEWRFTNFLRTIMAVLGASIAFGLMVFAYTHWVGVMSFLSATVVAFLLHIMLIYSLRYQRR